MDITEWTLVFRILIIWTLLTNIHLPLTLRFQRRTFVCNLNQIRKYLHRITSLVCSPKFALWSLWTVPVTSELSCVIELCVVWHLAGWYVITKNPPQLEIPWLKITHRHFVTREHKRAFRCSCLLILFYLNLNWDELTNVSNLSVSNVMEIGSTVLKLLLANRRTERVI